uniref:Disease resistance protein RPM1 n=3 Tax=Triticum urartu TaxID=4572 RepID=A0A8R7QNH6_TRIUA
MDMELSPISASLGAMGSLPRKLHELLATKHWALRGVLMDEIHHLTADLCILYNFMLKLSDAPQDPPMAARYWMKDVRELSYDMEDFADQFVHAHGRAKIPIANHRKNKTLSRVKIDRLPERHKWRPGISHKISEFRSRAYEAIQRYWRYKFDDCGSDPGYSRIAHGRPTNLPDPDDLVGIEGPSKELERWLIDGEEQLKVVSIVGVAGIGKTTLALRLWGMLRGQFECGAFVQTAQKPDMRGILRNILFQVRPHQPPNHGEMRHLINGLREYLQDKRYLIIIDDMWATSVWDVVSRAFPQSDCFSRIVTTTEIMEVALACCCFFPEHILKMEPLSDIDSEKLLLQRILVSRNQSPPQSDDVTPQIIRSCGGLPLAIIIVARILASQPEKLEQWGSTQNSFDCIIGDNPTMEGFMGPILNICFINLPHHLKTCLLHLSTYPEGYLFLKEDSVKQWVAEGFICANEGEDMEEVAGCYFEELVCMGLIQAMDINCDYELLSYLVHQVVLDLITYKSIEENFITVVDYSQTTIPLADKVRRLSLHFGSATCATTPESTRLSQVRSLFFSGLFNCMPSFVVFKLLRVLILHLWDDTGTKTLNLAGICELFRLRYLQITCNVTVKLPDKIEGMKHLETLQINAQVLDIPPDIVRLPSLLHLSLRGANLPSGIGCIRSLRTLMYFDLGNCSEDNLWGIGELTNLRDLHLTYSSSLSSEHLKRNLIALASSLGKLCNLKSLTLAARTTGTAGTVVLFDGSSGMSAPFFLERLELLMPICIFSRLPKCIGQLRKICIIKVAVRELPMSDIAILTGLPSLTVLWLSVQTAPEGRIVFNDKAFPVLKYFKFRCGVLCMSFMAGAMPNLRRLKLGFNSHIGEKYDNMLAGIEHLLTLQCIAAQIGATTESDWRAAESAIHDAIDKHPRFPRSNTQWVDLIEEECRPSEKHHWSQEKVSLGEKYVMNKHADSGLSQLPNLPSTIASGHLKSGSSIEEPKKSVAPSLPCTLHHTRISIRKDAYKNQRARLPWAAVVDLAAVAGCRCLLGLAVHHRRRRAGRGRRR